jgi:hypothetical protein
MKYESSVCGSPFESIVARSFQRWVLVKRVAHKRLIKISAACFWKLTVSLSSWKTNLRSINSFACVFYTSVLPEMSHI